MMLREQNLGRILMTAKRFWMIGFILLLFIGTSWLVASARNDPAGMAVYTFEGRVYNGPLGDESRPVAGVTVSLYGANSAYPNPGVFIRSTTTDGAGWYGLTITDADPPYEYYKIIETDPSGYESVGATSVGGTVYTSNWVEYVIPLGGKVLTGNKFWDLSPAGTPTPTPTPTSTPPAQICQGRVFDGEIGNESYPLSGVSVSLYGANGPYPNPGILLNSTTTDGNGWYGLPCPDGYEFYAIRESDPPNYISVGAASISGVVREANWIEIAAPLGGKDLTGNKFWDTPGIPTPTNTLPPTPTRTLTPTQTRTPTKTLILVTLVPPDLAIDAVEITQGIQCKGNASGLCADNAVPLISGKTTYVRVYVKVNWFTPISNVSASAVASTSDSPNIVGTALNSTITAKLSPQRSQYNDTLNFVFSSWDLSSSGTLVVTVNPDHTIQESDYSNNTKTVSLNFESTNPLVIVPVWVRYKYGGADSYVNSNMPLCLDDYTSNLLPVGEVQWSTLSGPALLWTTQISTDAQWGQMLQAIRDLRNKNWYWNMLVAPLGAHYYGMLPFTLVEGNAGLGDYPGWSAIGRVPMAHENLEDGADILVHELGHNFNRQHADCSVPDPDPNYPWPGAYLGDYGWDPQVANGGKTANYPTGYVVSAISYDVMSYCQDEWIGEYTYRGILDYVGSWATPRAGANLLTAGEKIVQQPSQYQPYLFVSGTLGDAVVLAPWAIHEGPEGFNGEPGMGSYSLRLLDAAHQILFERNFEPEVSKPSRMLGAPRAPAANEQFAFYQIVPWHPATASVEIWQGGTLLAQRAASANQPVVELFHPLPDDSWSANGAYLIEWGANDGDGGPLWFDVAFSRDAGVTWQIIATRLQDTYLEVRGDQFPGTPGAMIRVYASDGLLTSQMTSGIFTIEPKPPEVVISSPQNGTIIPPGMPVVFSGHAVDREDGTLTGNSLVWESDRDGALGTGDKVLVTLSPGWHTIYLTATDIPGNPATASVVVFVGYNLYLPQVGRGASSP
jgi:hypothetical protein